MQCYICGYFVLGKDGQYITDSDLCANFPSTFLIKSNVNVLCLLCYGFVQHLLVLRRCTFASMTANKCLVV